MISSPTNPALRLATPLLLLAIFSGLFLLPAPAKSAPPAARRPAAEADVEAGAGDLDAFQATRLAIHIYRPGDEGLPDGIQQLSTIDSSRSGLYAEFFTRRRGDAGAEPQECAANGGTGGACSELIVVIRGSEFGKILSDPQAFLLDARASAQGGLPQWYDLRAPLLDWIDAREVTRISLVGHSLGGMVAQLAAAELMTQRTGLSVNLFLVNSPGVSQIISKISPEFMSTDIQQVQITHVVHQEDAIPRFGMFGLHHPQTTWHLLSDRPATPHSLENLLLYLEASQGQLPPPMSADQVTAFLSELDELGESAS